MEEERTIHGKEIIKALLGNKWLYLIMLSVFFIASFVGMNLYSARCKEYTAFFDYNVAGFNVVSSESGEEAAYFIDGEKFDPRSIVTPEKMKEYFASQKELHELIDRGLYNKNIVKSFEYTTRYKENNHKMDDNDAAFIKDKKGFEIVFNSYGMSQEQAKILCGCIANEVIKIAEDKIEHISYLTYIDAFNAAKSYPEKIDCLVSGINYVQSLSDNLKESFGDIIISSGKYGGDEEKYYLNTETIGAWQNKMMSSFKRYLIDSLQSELEVNGYIIPESVDYIEGLKTSLVFLNRQIGVDEAVLADLKTQRDALVASIGSYATIESVEIREYNTEIIALTKKIAEQKEQVELYQLQLEKLDQASLTQEQRDAYNTNLAVFENKLVNIYNDLVFYTKQYESISKTTMKTNLHVYFDNVDVVTVRGELELYMIFLASIAIAIVGPMIVNLAIKGFNLAEGKSLLKK